MSKIIEITNCSVCPYREFRISELMQDVICKKSGRRMRNEDIDSLNKNGFPEWCPLKNKE